MSEPMLDRLRTTFDLLVVARGPSLRLFYTRVFTAGMVTVEFGAPTVIGRGWPTV